LSTATNILTWPTAQIYKQITNHHNLYNKLFTNCNLKNLDPSRQAHTNLTRRPEQRLIGTNEKSRVVSSFSIELVQWYHLDDKLWYDPTLTAYGIHGNVYMRSPEVMILGLYIDYKMGQDLWKGLHISYIGIWYRSLRHTRPTLSLSLKSYFFFLWTWELQGKFWGKVWETWKLLIGQKILLNSHPWRKKNIYIRCRKVTNQSR